MEKIITKRIESYRDIPKIFGLSSGLIKIMKNYKFISSILNLFPPLIRYIICPHNFFGKYGNRRGALYIKRNDLKTEYTEGYITYVTIPHECVLCGHLEVPSWTSDKGYTFYGPRGGYDKDFEKYYKFHIKTLGINLNNCGSYYHLEYKVACYEIWKKENADHKNAT